MKKGYYRGLYLIGSLYDLLLGFGFLFFYKTIYAFTGMNLPPNPAYLSLCALLIGIYGILLFMIYQDIEKSRKMIIYSILVKFAFVAVVFGYYFFINKTYIDLPFRIVGGVDLIFGFLFLESLRFVKK